MLLTEVVPQFLYSGTFMLLTEVVPQCLYSGTFSNWPERFHYSGCSRYTWSHIVWGFGVSEFYWSQQWCDILPADRSHWGYCLSSNTSHVYSYLLSYCTSTKKEKIGFSAWNKWCSTAKCLNWISHMGVFARWNKTNMFIVKFFHLHHKLGISTNKVVFKFSQFYIIHPFNYKRMYWI